VVDRYIDILARSEKAVLPIITGKQEVNIHTLSTPAMITNPSMMINPESMMQTRVENRLRGIEFLRLYRLDATVWGRINKYVKKIVGPGFSFIPDPSKVKSMKAIAEKEAEELNQWADEVGLERVLKIITKDCFVYGRGFIELSYNAFKNDILYLHSIDPVNLDYQRQLGTRRVLIDDYAKPMGYIYRERYQNQILLDANEVAHFKFFEISELDLGQSPMEPLYNVIVSKANIEKAAGEIMFRKGFPLWVLYVGDPNNPPSAEAIEYANKEFTNLDRVTEVIFPYYYKVDKVEGSSMDQIEVYHNLFRNVINEGFLSNASPKGRNRLVEVTDLEEEEIIKTFQMDLAEQVVSQITYRLCKARKYRTIPGIRFYEIKPATQLTYIRELSIMMKNGAITNDLDTENWVRANLLQMPQIKSRPEPVIEANPMNPAGPGLPSAKGAFPTKGKVDPNKAKVKPKGEKGRPDNDGESDDGKLSKEDLVAAEIVSTAETLFK